MKLKAQKREIDGSKVKHLRREGVLPAVVFGNNKESTSIQVSELPFIKVYNHSGETEVIDLEVDGLKDIVPVLVSEIQYHPVTQKILHISFREINLSEKVKVHIPLEFVGEEKHPLIKNGNAILITFFDELEVEALPRDIPSEITLEVESLKEVGDMLTIKDVKALIDTSKVELSEEDEETPIAKLDYAEMQEVEEAEPMSVDDIEVTTGAKEEGDEKSSEDKEGGSEEEKKDE